MALFKNKNNRKDEKIEVTLTQSGIMLRLVFMVVALTIASIAFYSVFSRVLHTESGWQVVTAKTKSGVGNDFVFHYRFGVSGTSSSQEWARLNKLYPTLLDRANELFDSGIVPGTGNLYQLNSNPNEAVYIEPDLYSALQKVEDSGSRFIYYAPVFSVYKSMFSCDNDYSAYDFDPFINEEIGIYVEKLCSFVKDSHYVNLELLDNSQVILHVSDEYLAFAKENEIDSFLDFFYLKNAFVIDYVANGLIEQGYTAGVIGCTEGFSRALGQGEYSQKRYFYRDGAAPLEESFSYSGSKSVVFLKDYLVYGEDSNYYYETDNHEIRHIFINPETGLSREGMHEVLAISEKLGCSDIVLVVYDAFVKNDIDVKTLEKLGINVD